MGPYELSLKQAVSGRFQPPGGLPAKRSTALCALLDDVWMGHVQIHVETEVVAVP